MGLENFSDLSNSLGLSGSSGSADSSKSSVVIGDSFFVASMLYGGFERGIVALDQVDAQAKIDEVIKEGKTKLIVVPKGLFEKGSKYINGIKAASAMPFILELDNV